MKGTRNQVRRDSKSRMYNEVAPWGLLSGLVNLFFCLPLVLWLQASVYSVPAPAFVCIRWWMCLRAFNFAWSVVSLDHTSSLRACSLHGPGIPAHRCTGSEQPCLQLGPCLGGISCLWTKPLSHPGQVCQSLQHTYFLKVKPSHRKSNH